MLAVQDVASGTVTDFAYQCIRLHYSTRATVRHSSYGRLQMANRMFSVAKADFAGILISRELDRRQQSKLPVTALSNRRRFNGMQSMAAATLINISVALAVLAAESKRILSYAEPQGIVGDTSCPRAG